MRRVLALFLLSLVAVAASFSLSYAGESGYANVVTVSATGADFTGVAAAVNSITDASENNRYLVRVYPGTYSGQVVCKPFVDIIGTTANSVILTHNGTSTLSVCHSVHIRNMTILATAVGGNGITGGGYDTTLANLKVEANQYGIMVGGDPPGEREPNIDRWITIRDCSFKSNCQPAPGGWCAQAADFWDSTMVHDSIFTVNSAGGSSQVYGVVINGNTILRDCQINMTVTGTSPGEVGAVWNTDAATPVRLERTSINVRATNESASFPVFGVRNGADITGAVMDIDHCSITVSNAGSGTTHEIQNMWNDPEPNCDYTRVFATKYAPHRVYGRIVAVSQGNQVVDDLTVTGDLNVEGDVTIELPAKDKTRVFPLLVAGTSTTNRKLLGDHEANPTVGYSFPDNVTLTKLTLIGQTPGSAWAYPEVVLYLFKNGDYGAVMELYNESGTSKILSTSMDLTPYSLTLTPNDKISYWIEVMSEITDAAIMLEYSVD